MREPPTTMSETERYTVWCEQVRALFTREPCGAVEDAADSNNDDAYFPECFYMRMLGALKKCGGDGVAVERSRRSSISSDSCFSSVSQQRNRVDEDVLASRLASKLEAHARVLSRQRQRQQQKRQEEAATVRRTATRLPFRDCAVEAKVAAINEDLHDALLYVRQRNMLSNQLRRQLEETRRLLVMQVPSSS
ncbi:hypothetical protein, conserved [Trypanosoma brucei gambiense DAL972]|uniref:Uncharacterized protein n=1 Tax=Trypanosoma brucei gambiense (strain MHOM/CI/86/DAL972) TaxID=679716 RepID=C9ZYM1_TRYB9|nr:hypothetical protein, conserved [Trypanosoma brucei gambiense DAL972]CBH14520.1 hypothetical protein, conserved [Trypanosoma brucei gambiense DAL972]|eukprot:XP_011776786.1 hypothetical protein, conserved [Trypanosoma brucei gambiense DAL972]